MLNFKGMRFPIDVILVGSVALANVDGPIR